ncbi:unnamed protein product [Blepharisma stoltei]|uniref:Vacuolar protein sorting-associated protein 8 central domain-containing protein n=1 Tax=Blepharisma stoltei TaxID=1481888 RepID=A0AAU9IZB9_9CILI|nr:unnamed protein product [Blepharisma stoltei]
MVSRHEELMKALGDDDFDPNLLSDPNYVDTILKGDEEIAKILKKNEMTSQSPKTSYSHRFTQDRPEDPSSNKEKLESLLQGDRSTQQVPIETVDPLDLIHKKELEDASKTEKILTNSLDVKRQYTASKLPVIKFEELTLVSKKIAPTAGYSTGLPTALTASKHLIVVGNTHGIMMSFSHDGQELKSMRPGKENFGAVTCIDITEDEQYAIAGYHLGQVALWDLRSGNCIKASNNFHKSPILSIKFWKKVKTYAISADATGKVNLLEYGKSFLSTKVNAHTLFTNEIGVCVTIEVLYSDPYLPHPCDQATIIAIGSMNFVVIYSIEPELNCIFRMARPDNVVLGAVPCVSWKVAIGPDDEQPTDPILAIAWGQKIVLYKLRLPTKEGIQISGFLDMDTEIKSLIWLSHDMLFVMGNSREIRIANTKGFSRREKEPSRNAILEDTYVNRDLAIQAYIRDESGKERYTFHNSVKAFERVVFILGNRQFHKGRLLNWKECIETLTSKGEWLDVLSLGLDVYQGKGKKLYGVPSNKNELRKSLEKVITDYVKLGTVSWEFKISNSIEFCIGIEAFELLFNQLFDFFVGQGTQQENQRFFMDTLEPFILNHYIKSIPISVLGKIIAYYINMQKPDTVEKILLNLDPTTIDPRQVIPVCEEYNLLTAYIFINTNSTLQSFVNPLKKIYKTLTKQEDPKSKRYFAYKLIWYLRLCLKGETFPSGKILNDIWGKVIIGVIGWLLKRKHLQTLIDIDAPTTLNVLWMAFSEKFPSNLLSQKRDNNITHREILDRLEQVCLPNSPTFQHFTLFIAKAASINQSIISKQICVKTAKYLMQPLQARRPQAAIPMTSSIDNYLTVTSLNEGSEFQLNTEYTIEEKGSLILKMLKTCGELTSDEIDDLFRVAVNSPYIEVLVYLQELKKEYANCLSAFIHSEKIEIKRKVFDWLADAFAKLNESELEVLKTRVMDWLNILVEIDSDRTAKIVRDWFSNEQQNIIHKLDSAPQLQMKYLGELVKGSAKDTLDHNLIIQYIRLLCELQPDQVLEFLMVREDYSLDDALDICMNYKVADAAAFLHERLGSVRDALDIMLELVHKKQTSLLNKISSKDHVSDTSIQELNKDFDEAIKLCMRSSKREDAVDMEEHWFSLLNKALVSYKQFLPYFKNHQKLEIMVQSSIKEILDNMMDIVDFDKIIAHIVTNFGDIPFRYFKENIVGVLSRYSYQKNIVRKATNLLNNDIRNMTQELLLLRSKGVCSKDFTCSYCGLTIQSEDLLKGHDEKLLLFICGHTYHGRCSKRRECEACRKEENRKGKFMSATAAQSRNK